MNRLSNMENAQNFIEEYENIKETLDNLIDDIEDKKLKQEIFELSSAFEEDYSNEYNTCLEVVQEGEQEELEYQNYEFERSRI